MPDVHLTDDEALVLFGFLSRYSEIDQLAILHPSEQRALWNLCGVLESTLVQPFSPDYHRLLAEAQARLDDGEP